MTDARAPGAQAQTGRGGPASEHMKAATAVETTREDAVTQLARALRSARRAHTAYLAELQLGDVEPAEDWSTWYAEYLLGQGDR
jgi:hypothetical protein